MTYYVGDQHETFPYSAVAYIETTFSNGATYTGSGAVVGRNDILTSSHLIYSPSDGGLAEGIEVYPGRDGYDVPFGAYESDYVDYFEVDQDGDGMLSTSDSEDDIAVLGFDTAFGNETGWFAVDPYGTSGNYNLTGYPSVYADASGPRMTNDSGYASLGDYSYVFEFSSIEANPGNSGGPLWYEADTGPALVGVLSTEGWAADVYAHYSEIVDWIDSNDFLLSNAQPECVNDRAVTRAGQPVIIDVLANDSDPDGDLLNLAAVQDPVNGSVRITNDDRIEYTPADGYAGSDLFTYTAADPNGGTASGIVNVTIEPFGPDNPEDITTMNGFRASGSTFADVIQNRNQDTAWYRIWNQDSGEFYTENARKVSDNWVTADSLQQMNLPSDNVNRFAVNSWGTNSGRHDWMDFTVSIGSENSTVALTNGGFAANQTITYDRVIAAGGLDSQAWLRVFNEDEGLFLDASGDGWIRGSELNDHAFSTGDPGQSIRIWVDTYLHGNGRSGWEDVEISAESPDAPILREIGTDDENPGLAGNDLSASDGGFSSPVQANDFAVKTLGIATLNAQPLSTI